MKWLALGLLVVGCATEPVRQPVDLVMTVDPSFSPEEVLRLYAAADAWRTVTPRVNIQFAGDRYKGEYGVLQVPPNRHGWIGVDGLSWQSTHTVWLTPGFSTVQAMHEFGHLLGLEHTVHGVMRDLAEEGWSAEDQGECERVGVCP